MPTYLHDLALKEIQDDVQDMDLVPDDRVRIEEDPDFDKSGIAIHWDDEFEAEGTMGQDWWVYPCYVTLIQGKRPGRTRSILPVSTFRQKCRRTWNNQRIAGLISSLPAGNCHLVAQVKPHTIYVPAKYRSEVHVSSMLVLVTIAEHRTVET